MITALWGVSGTVAKKKKLPGSESKSPQVCGPPSLSVVFARDSPLLGVPSPAAKAQKGLAYNKFRKRAGRGNTLRSYFSRRSPPSLTTSTHSPLPSSLLSARLATRNSRSSTFSTLSRYQFQATLFSADTLFTPNGLF